MYVSIVRSFIHFIIFLYLFFACWNSRFYIDSWGARAHARTYQQPTQAYQHENERTHTQIHMCMKRPASTTNACEYIRLIRFDLSCSYDVDDDDDDH